MHLRELTKFLDEYFAISDCPDISLNGLQVEGKPHVKKIALAVDACSETFHKSAALKADILLTHHGIFWNRQFPVTGIHADRLKTLFKNNISLYAVHHPLDIHPEIGNSAGLIALLGFEKDKPFGESQGIYFGFTGSSKKPVAYSTLIKRIHRNLGVKPIGYKFGKDRIKTIAVISGSGASSVEEASEAQVDLFLTGELRHSSYHLAKELAINLVFCGHYATETIGIQLLGEVITKNFGLDTIFIDVPTGM